MNITPNTVRAAKNQYLDWLDQTWWRVRGWKEGFRDMLFWYSIAGAAVLGEGTAWSMLDDAKRGKKLPLKRPETWRQAKALSRFVSDKEQTNPIDWFTGGSSSINSGWQSLYDIMYIGPKIASWLMRDLGLMRDYSYGRGGKEVQLRTRASRSWYEKLPAETQALFIPVDVWVYEGAKQCGIRGVFKKYDVNKIQLNPDLHVDAATQIVRWARRNGYDPRDLDIYWYLTGSGKAG